MGLAKDDGCCKIFPNRRRGAHMGTTQNPDYNQGLAWFNLCQRTHPEMNVEGDDKLFAVTLVFTGQGAREAYENFASVLGKEPKQKKRAN